MKWEYEYITKGGMGETSKGSYSKTVISESYKINGIKTIPIRYTSGHLDFLIKDGSGIYRYAKQSANDFEPQIHDEKIVWAYVYPIKIGTSWNNEWPTYLLAQSHKILTKSTIEKLNASVITKAGIFEDCLLIKTFGEKYLDDSNALTKNAKVRIESYSYYAPNVGWVKQIVKHSSNNMMVAGPGNGTASRVFELIQFTK